MKSFLRKFAAFMAVVLMVTAITPAFTSQAAAMSLSQSKVTLYLGGDTTQDIQSTATLTVKQKGSYTVSYTSSRKKVAAVGKSSGIITAKGVGTATITAVVKNGTKTVKTLKCKVTVKRHAASIGVRTALANLLANGITAGSTYSNKVFFRKTSAGKTVWGTGSKVISDVINCYSSDSSVFTVNKTSGQITAVAEGSATLTLKAVSTDNSVSTVVMTKTYPVNVKAAAASATPTPAATATPTPTLAAGKLTAVSQNGISDMSSVALTFSDEQTAQKVLATPSLLKIQFTRGTSSARSTVTYYNSLTAGSDAKTLIIKFYEQIPAGTTYYFSYDGDTELSLAGAGNTPATLVLTDTTVTTGTETAIPYKVYNANGVDITSAMSAGTDYISISFKTAAENANYYINGSKICITKDGVAAEVVGTMIVSYDSKGNPVTLTGRCAIASKAASTSTSSITWGTAKTGTAASAVTYGSSAITISLTDPSTSLYAKYTKTVGTTKTTFYLPATTTDYKFASAATDLLLIDSATGQLVPVGTTGTAQILVKDTSGNVVQVIAVTIVASRELASVTLSPSASNISTASTEEINVDVDALDSTGNDLTLDSITSAVVSGAASDVNISYDANYTGINISCNGTFEGKTFTGTKTIVIKFTFTKDKTSITRNYVINIKAATSSTISSYKVNFGTPIVSTDTTKAAPLHATTITVGGYDSDGYYIDDADGITVAASESDLNKTSGIFTMKVLDPSGNYVTTGISGSGTDMVKFDAIGTSGGYLTKAQAGTYTVTVYKGNGTVAQFMASSTFTVADGAALTLTAEATTVSNYNELVSVFSAKRGTTDVTGNITSITPTTDGYSVVDKTVVIRKVYVYETTSLGTLRTLVEVNKTFTIS
jgi:hypothetical protein